MKIMIGLLCSLVLLSADAVNLKGPFKAEALAFYFVHNGCPLVIELNLTGQNGAVVTGI
jgi:hypothetical protein